MHSPNNPELLRLFVQYTPAAVALCDHQMRYLLTSHQWLTDYGLEKQEIIGRSHYEVFPLFQTQTGTSVERWKEIYQRCLAGGVKQCEEDYFIKLDGSISWVKWQIQPWRNEVGEIGGLIFVTEDITEHKQSSELPHSLTELETKQPAKLTTTTKIQVLGHTVEWHPKQGCRLQKLPVIMLWIDTALASLMAAMQAMVGQERFALALQREGRNSIEADWQVISQFEDFSEGVKALNALAVVAGWGEMELLSLDKEKKECLFRGKNSWEGRYQKALGVCWGSRMIAGKLSGYCSRLFKTNCWAEQTAFIARGDEYDEFLVQPSKRSIEEEIEKLLDTDEATRADMAVALQKLKKEVSERQRAEKALAKSEARNRAFLEAIPDMMFRLGKDSMIRDFRAPQELKLVQPHQLTGKSLYEVLPPEVAEQAMDYTEKALSTGETQVFEYQLLVQGKRRYQESRVVVSGDSEVLAIVRDITERKSAEEALQKSEELYRTLARNLPNGAVMLFDHQLCFTLAEGTELAAVGLSKEFIEGKTLGEVFPPETSDQLKPTYEAALVGEATVIEVRFAERLYLVHTLPVKNERGEIIAGMTLAQNITQAKQAEEALRQKNHQLEQALRDLQKAQAQLIQSEKMSSLGQLVAGVAHEINNPVNFIYGNLIYAREYTEDLLNLLQVYQQYYPTPLPEVQSEIEAADLDFLKEDLPKLLSSMEIGAERICEIVRSLRNFSRVDEAEMKEVDLHEGIDSTLLILQNRLRNKPNQPCVEIIKAYSNLPKVECYPGQLNQVFMNILTNALDALEEMASREAEKSDSWEEVAFSNSQSTNKVVQREIQNPQIRICTEIHPQLSSSATTLPSADLLEDSFSELTLEERVPTVLIKIADNGPGMSAEVAQRLFDPFFTTKPIGVGTGLGLSISYQIVVEKHRGHLSVDSQLGQGTEFIIEIPIHQSNNI